MKRLLITACSATKHPSTGLLPAVTRYRGPSFLTLAKWQREHPAQATDLDILILSGLFGLIRGDTPIPEYNHRMTLIHAAELRPQVYRRLLQRISGTTYGSTLINLGADYLPALQIPDTAHLALGTITETTGGIGARLGQLKAWLESTTPVTDT